MQVASLNTYDKRIIKFVYYKVQRQKYSDIEYNDKVR